MYTIIDIETTGNGIKGNKITEIAIFKFDGHQIVDEFTSLVNPKCPIPYFITGLTGINDQMVQNAPVFTEIAEKVLEITQDCTFVAHAVNFDYGVIKEEFRSIGIEFTRKKLCTVRLSRKLIPGLQSYSLGKLCSTIGIPLKDRHRARGDAHATVLLFKKIVQSPDSEKVIAKFLNARSQEATLPPLLPKTIFDNLPPKPGIYYFKDANGTIIYVGKAINIKKRVLGHFYDKSHKEVTMCKEIMDIDHELSGSELVALLMESAAIKKHFPIYNQAQKRRQKQYALFRYEDRRGVIHLAYNVSKNVVRPLQVFYNEHDCRAYLEKLCDEFSLCPKYCHLQQTYTSCSHHSLKHCKGICKAEESVESYNERVRAAIFSMEQKKANHIIKEKGRTTSENAFVLLKNGKYEGYGFIENHHTISTIEDIEAFIIPQKNTLETQRIVEASLQKRTAFSFESQVNQ